MSKAKHQYIYGPVSSWRLGSSLGVDPVAYEEKVCTFDCIYCQVGSTDILNTERKFFVPTDEIVKEVKSLPSLKIDYITFSGRGEPTLAKNLGEIIREIKKIRKEPVAILTNASLIYRKDVQEDLSLADFVMAKLDACSEEIFSKVNGPARDMLFCKILDGIKDFRSFFKGKFALQIMFMEENKACAEEIARIAREINPDEVQINTPLRPSKVRPLSKKELDNIKDYFKGMNIISVYDVKKHDQR